MHTAKTSTTPRHVRNTVSSTSTWKEGSEWLGDTAVTAKTPPRRKQGTGTHLPRHLLQDIKRTPVGGRHLARKDQNALAHIHSILSGGNNDGSER